MNIRIITLLLYLSFILVTGCSSSDPSGTNSPSNVSGNAAIFNPSTGEIPLPNILATATAKSPLTLKYPFLSSDPVVRTANTPMTPPEALAYINYYEVGSTNAVSGVNAPIYIRFTNPVDAATVTASNIKVFQISADTTSSSSPENNPLGFTDVTGMFTFKYSAGSTDLFLFPNFPLSPGTRYLYVVSKRVLDAAGGTPIVGSSYFELLKSKFELVGPFAALEPIRANVMSGTTIRFSGYAKIMDDLIAAAATTKIAGRDDIALMGRFITTGAGFVSKDAIGTMMPVESALRAFAAGAGLGGLPGITWTNTVTVTTPSGLTPAAYWAALGAGPPPSSVSAVTTGAINSAELSIDPVVAKASAATMDLTAITGAYNPAAGVTQAYRDASGNLTGYYHTTKSVPFVLLAPVTSNGKVVIFQHGITGQKEQVVAVAGSLTAAGYTVVAIDLPLHGALAVPTHTTGAVWGQDFMALGAPLATRSNVQQAAFNLNRLELTMRTGGFATLGIVPAPAVDIKYVGMSLGSIVGTYYLAGNTALATSGLPYTQTTLNSDMKGFLSVPGGRLAYLLMDSPAFSPSINAGLAAKGIAAGTPTYNSFFQVTQSVVDPVDPATMTTPLAAGLPSRLSGRIVIQEATGGDMVIPNANTRYLGNALGGRGVLGAAGASVAPGFRQLGYNGSASVRIPATFMYMLDSGGVPTPKTDFAAALASATIPTEGYFQFDQEGVSHSFLLDPTNSPVATQSGQRQMVYFLTAGIVVDPTVTGTALPKVAAKLIPGLAGEILLPPVLKIFGY
jgi:pimeloyl-ACP methyl ester carboxylesterase